MEKELYNDDDFYPDESEDEEFDEEAEAKERYPFLFDGPETESIREYERTEIESVRVTTSTDGSLVHQNKSSELPRPNYHHLHELADDLLPTLDFYRYDNLFSARPARSVFAAKANLKKPETLFGNHWRSGEIAILFADTGAGKSILATQIAESVASGTPFGPFPMTAQAQRVAYFDLELTDAQFARRYSSDDIEHPAEFPFSVNFIRCPPREVSEVPPDHSDYTAYLTSSMIDFIEFSGAKVVIIDNITWLNNSSQIGNSAARVMKALQRLKRQLGLSILVLAHTPKRFVHSRLTINDLQGSKMLANFADSVFAMGTSRRGPDVRYLKGIKHRSTAARATQTEVATIRLAKDECFLGFSFEEFSDERDHVGWLRSALEPERLALATRAAELAAKHLTQRQIADELGVSATTVNRCLKAIKE